MIKATYREEHIFKGGSFPNYEPLSAAIQDAIVHLERKVAFELLKIPDYGK